MACKVVFVLLFVGLFHDISATNGVAVLNKVANVLGKANVAFGKYSRSTMVMAISRSLRGDDDEKVKESLNQAIVTLAVLDFGGGILLPFTEHIINVITKNQLFTVTADAWKNYNVVLHRTLNGNLKNLDDDHVKFLLNKEKKKILAAFDGDVAKLGSQGKATLKHLNKAKRWLRVKSVGKVLGPLFDVVGIGVNSWALHTVIRDCKDDPGNCNLGSVAAATLSIASGIVGLTTFFASLAISSTVLGPVGAIVSFVLALGATLIELFYKPPPDQAAIDRAMKIGMMKELDRYSRLQLYAANKFLSDNEIDRSDLYVANQGHLPKWFSYDKAITIRFGMLMDARPRKRFPRVQTCERPVFGNAPVPFNILRSPSVCPYLADGYNLITSEQESLGFGLYGFTKTARSYNQYGGDNYHDQPDTPYEGSIVLINTDKVQADILAEQDLGEKLRGLYIRTDLKNGDTTESLDDLVAIGNLPNLDRNEKVVVKMGAGNDALNIDGMLGGFSSEFQDILDADLGLPGHNSLNFHAIADDSPIKGIKYNAQNGRLEYMHGGGSHHVGFVKNVEILGASPFSDDIKLYANKAGDNGVDFTVIKYKGHGIYTIDLGPIRAMSETRNFKIIDSTDNGHQSNQCHDFGPILRLNNFGNDAVANDVLYRGDKVLIFGTRIQTGERKNRITKNSKRRLEKSRKRSLTQCSGEPADGSHPEGGTNGKVLLATVALYSKCPAGIHTFTENGCMMYPRSISDLDLAFFQGMKLSADFTRDVSGSDKADFLTLRCPKQLVDAPTVINLGRGSRDYVVMRSDVFLEPCNINGDDATVILVKEQKRRIRNVWKLHFLVKGSNVQFGGGGREHELKGVEKIINEYGDLVVNLKNEVETMIPLYDAYTKATMKNIGELIQRGRSKEVENDILMCLKDVENPTPEQQEACE